MYLVSRNLKPLIKFHEFWKSKNERAKHDLIHHNVSFNILQGMLPFKERKLLELQEYFNL